MITGKEIRDKRKKMKLSAVQLADLIHVNVQNLYKWEKGHLPQDPVDYMKLENWLNGKVENVPIERVPVPYSTPVAPSHPDAGYKAILNLSEANLILAKNNESLVVMIEATVRAAKGSPLNQSGLIGDLQELMMEISSGRRKMTTQDALKELQKVVGEYIPGR